VDLGPSSRLDLKSEVTTIDRQAKPLEALIEEWLARDQISLLCGLVARAQKELADAWTPRVLTQPSQRSQEAILHELNSACRF
jgi:oligoribonuclease (3'-5' exoribonuclease)